METSSLCLLIYKHKALGLLCGLMLGLTTGKSGFFYSQICATSVKWLKSLIIFSKPVQHSNTKLKIWKNILIKIIHTLTLWTKTGQTECLDITEFVCLFVSLQSTYRLQCMGQRRDLGCLLFQSLTSNSKGCRWTLAIKRHLFPDLCGLLLCLAELSEIISLLFFICNDL